MLAVVVVLAALGALSLELFFVLSLIGLLVVIELTAPFDVTPAWRRRLKWLIALGLLGFAYVVAVPLGYGLAGVYAGMILSYGCWALIAAVGFVYGDWAATAAGMMAERAAAVDE
jgi:hypothetical protein